MSKLAKSFTKVLRDQIRVYAAWLPVTNTFEVGDFGLIDAGVFNKMGNIGQAFNVDFQTADGPPSEVDFTSAGTRVAKFVAGAQVDGFPSAGDLDAKIEIQFSNEDSFILKAKLTSVAMQNIHTVALQLAKNPGWDRRFKVISTTYTGDKSVVIASSQKDTKISLSGTVSALQEVEAGKVSTEVGFAASNESYFKSIGDSGVIGLSLFRVKRKGRVDFLREEDVEVETDLGNTLENDL